MKALTVRQPWASLIMEGTKRVENRSWPTRHRGLLAIHAGRYGAGWDLLPRGVVLGVVDLVDCHEADSPDCCCTDYASPTGWHWVLEVRERFAHPVSAPGRQGLWEWVDGD